MEVLMDIIAEVGNVHDGSLGECHAYIDAVADVLGRAGVTGGVKFQCHLSDFESTKNEKFPDRFSFHPQDLTRGGYWNRLEFSLDEWKALQVHAHDNGLIFIVSPFSVEAVKMLGQLVDAWKVASGELTHHELIKAMVTVGQGEDWWCRRVILSTGMARYQQVLDAWELLPQEIQLRSTVLQCCTEYPTPPAHVGINSMKYFARSYGRVGLSDHSGTIFPGLIAAYEGASMAEVHVCWDKRQWHPDVCSSLDMEQLKQLAEGVRLIEQMGAVDKNKLAAELPDIKAYTEGKQR